MSGAGQVAFGGAQVVSARLVVDAPAMWPGWERNTYGEFKNFHRLSDKQQIPHTHTSLIFIPLARMADIVPDRGMG